jgi:C1A family cysteine protease
VNKFGWIPDYPDHRDQKYKATWVGILPPVVRRLAQMPPIYNQGSVGSCTGNGTARCIQYCRRMQGLPDFVPSRLMLYYDAREREGTTDVDSGAQIRDAVKGAVQNGACPETEWPYDESKFRVKPDDSAYAAGAKDEVIGYHRVDQSVYMIRAALAMEDPVVFGFSVYDSFMSLQTADTGVVTVPQQGEQFVGGHCVVAVGYDDNRRMILCDNSWGEGWGFNGSFWMPYEYIENSDLAQDFWVVRLVTEPASRMGK